ncbi:MAG: dUTPase [Christensenellaceae bacterium]|jgi:dimeric dUTPase (all-alpha-NTP-PPase superfamily)|nr:dUTPase [Christensenellaceae bacterium]
MDKLDEIFALQQRFNHALKQERALNGIPPEEWIQKQVLAMISELAEVLDEARFKWWKNNAPVQPEKLKGELVDVLHFFVSMCLEAGMDASELHALYLDKNRVNFERQKGLWGKDYQSAAPGAPQE